MLFEGENVDLLENTFCLSILMMRLRDFLRMLLHHQMFIPVSVPYTIFSEIVKGIALDRRLSWLVGSVGLSSRAPKGCRFKSWLGMN